jgi:hypothetical protein
MHPAIFSSFVAKGIESILTLNPVLRMTARWYRDPRCGWKRSAVFPYELGAAFHMGDGVLRAGALPVPVLLDVSGVVKEGGVQEVYHQALREGIVPDVVAVNQSRRREGGVDGM